MKPTPCYKSKSQHKLHNKLCFRASSSSLIITMSSRLLFICILSAITSTSYSISCINCAAENKDLCIGISEKCPSPDDVCISTYERTTIGGAEATALFMRLCGNCNQYRTGSVRFHKGTININTTCCQHDNCTPPTPTLPPDKPTKDDKIKANGLTCKSCYASNIKTCDCNIYMSCTGDETKCIFRSTLTTGKHYYAVALRGCTRKEMCDITDADLMSTTTRLRYNFTCTDESDGLNNSFFLLALTTSLFFKFTSELC
ncbi:uncharacterized protein LOC142106840 [Mixophyes fleayi]|uniref:uncharacterized protein LOC142106840 n=1 Tax=Mixophyes fleayi TaxID=3061075 RepID=UPI003F4D9BBB